MVNTQQLAKRKQAAEQPLTVIRMETGYRVQSAQNSSKYYEVTVDAQHDRILCTCPDFQKHKADVLWKCKHVLAAIEAFKQEQAAIESGTGNGANGNGTATAPIQEAASAPKTTALVPARVATTQPHMLIKRSLSPDGRINSISIEIDFVLDGDTIGDIKTKAAQALKLQTEIITDFVATTEPKEPPVDTTTNPIPHNGNGAALPVAPLPATMVSIGVMDGKWGPRFFVNVVIDGKTVKLFGTQKQIAEHIRAAGYSLPAQQVLDGTKLQIPCRVTTQPSSDGRYVNIQQVFPAN